jgi:ABC-2 type transport system permease protein
MSIVPFTSPLAMAMRLALVNVPLTELALSIGLLAALDGVMIWLAGRLFRANSLLAGKVPKLKDFPALLRG